MPLYDFRCRHCRHEFEALWDRVDQLPLCPKCSGTTERLVCAPALHLRANRAPERIARRARDYLIDGKYKDAERFLEKASAYVRDDRVKKLKEKVSAAREKKSRRKNK